MFVAVMMGVANFKNYWTLLNSKMTSFGWGNSGTQM